MTRIRAVTAALALIASCACWCAPPPAAAPPRSCERDELGWFNCHDLSE